jgi:hypothetical protein
LIVLSNLSFESAHVLLDQIDRALGIFLIAVRIQRNVLLAEP